MADKRIGELPAAEALESESLLVVEQHSEARSIRGELVADFAREAARAYVAGAARSAEAAAQSARDAGTAREGAEAALARLGYSVEKAAASAEAAGQAEEGARSAESAAESAAARAEQAMADKQDKLRGAAGQVVGFDESGNAVAQQAPAGGMTQAEADRRYLAVAGGIVTGQVYMSAGLTLLNGGTVNGSLTLQSEPQSDSDAVNKGYVDQRLAELAKKLGVTL